MWNAQHVKTIVQVSHTPIALAGALWLGKTRHVETAPIAVDVCLAGCSKDDCASVRAGVPPQTWGAQTRLACCDFRESDRPNFCFRTNNCGFYSGSKALAEVLLAGAAHCYVWRMRMPFNHRDGERNYLSKLMRYERLLDTRNSLSHLDECVAACLQCFADGVPYGTYHLVNSGTLPTRETVEMIWQKRCMQ